LHAHRTMAETPTHGRVNCTGANSQSSEVAPSDPRDIGWQPPNPPPYLRPIKFDLNSQYLPAELETYLLSKCDDFTNRPATVPGDWNSMFNCFANIRYIPEAGEDRESIDRFRDFCNKATHEDYGNLIRGRVHTFTVDSKDISMVLVHRTKEFIQGTPAGRQYPFLLYMENMLMHAEDRIAEEYAAMFEWMQSNDKKPPIEHGAMQLTLPSFCHRQNPSNHPNRPFCQVSNSLYLGNFTDYMQSQSKSPAHLNNSNNLGDQPAPAAPSTNVPVAWHPSHLVHPTQLGLPTWAEGGRSSDAVFYELLNPTPLQYCKSRAQPATCVQCVSVFERLTMWYSARPTLPRWVPDSQRS